MFNGKRAIGLVTGDQLESPEVVLADMPAFDYFYVTENDARLREGATFRQLLDHVFSLDPSEATFYAHGKGVRYPQDHTVWDWARVMYEENLGDVQRTDRILGTNPCAGVFRMHGDAFDRTRYYPWHYSGSFYWFHNASLFSFPNWEDIDQTWYCVEPYLSQFFSVRQAACLGYEDIGSLYDKYTWDKLCRGRGRMFGAAPFSSVKPVFVESK